MDGVTTSVQPGMINVSTGGGVDLLGHPIVMMTSGRGFNPAELAEMFVSKLLAVSIDLPPEQLEQARAYRERIVALATVYMAQAQKSAHTTSFNELMNAGHLDAANLVKDL